MRRALLWFEAATRQRLLLEAAGPVVSEGLEEFGMKVHEVLRDLLSEVLLSLGLRTGPAL